MAMRPSGLPNTGALASGSHIVHFYRHLRDWMETHAAYCAAGLQHNEYCLWLTTPPCTETLARYEFEKLSIDITPYLACGQLEFISCREWYFDHGVFSGPGTVARSQEMFQRARNQGFTGIRACGNLSWVTTDQEWTDFLRYEHIIHQTITGSDVIGLCSYPIRTELDRTLVELLHSHHAVLRPHNHRWEYLPTTGLATP